MKTNQNGRRNTISSLVLSMRIALTIVLLFAMSESVLAQVNLNIGTLPPGKSVTVTFKVTINDPVPNGVCEVSNQGTVSGTNFSAVLTDDPDAGGAADPTVTPITLSPCTISGPDPVCSGTTGNPYTVSSDITSASFSWSISGSGTLAASTGSSVSVNAGEAGTYTLTVTASNGSCLTTCTKTATVNAAPACTISGSDPVCAGSSGNAYTVSTGVGGSTFSWAISGSGSISGSTTGSSVSVTAGSSSSYTLTVTAASPTGCTSTCTKTATIQNPDCTISGPDPVCAGSSGNTYTVSSNTGGSTFAWAISGDGSINGSTTGSSVSVNAGAAGSYALTVTSTTPAGCSATCTKTATVNAVPTCTISGPDAVCAGSTGNAYTVSSDVGGSAFAWAVSGSGTISGSTTGSAVTVTAGSSGTYTLTVTASNGSCLTTCTKTATVSAAPACTISGPDLVCAGSSGNVYTASSGIGGSTFSWSISGSGSISGSTTGSSVSVTAGSSSSYTLTVTAASPTGCTSTCTKTATIQNPGCTISGPDPVCAGSSGNTYTVSSNTGGSTFAWAISGNGTISGSTTGSSVSVNVGAAGSYTLTVTSTTPAGCSATCTKTATVNAVSACTISGPSAVCSGVAGNAYTVSSDVGGSSFAWSLSGNGTINGSSTGSSISVDAGVTGSYTLTVTVSNGPCSSTCTKTVTVNQTPACSITGPDPVCAGATNPYSAGTIVGYTSYSWAISGSGSLSSTTGSSVSVTAGSSGSYTLTVTATTTGCTSTCTKTATIQNPACTISGPGSVCTLSTNNFTVTSVTSASFAWTVVGDGTISGSTTGSSVSVNAGSSGSYTLTVTGTTPNNCKAICITTVSVENPACTISGPNPVCGSSTNAYTASNGTGASFSWAVTGDGTISGSTTGSSISVIAGSSGSYTLTVTSSTSGDCTSTCTTAVTVNPVPSCTVSGPDPVNGGSTNTYSATSSETGSSFTWSVSGSGTISGATTGSSASVVAGGCGSFTLTVTISKAGCSNTCTKTVSVNDVTPPTITDLSVSPATLWPPNHKLRDVTVSYSAADNCGGTPTCVLSVTSNEPVNGTGDGDTEPDWVVTDPHHLQLRAERAAGGNGRVYTITITCTDASGNSSDTTVTVIVAHNITDPLSGSSFKVGTSVNFAGTFWDVPGKSHTAQWIFDNLSTKGMVTEPSGLKNGVAKGSFKFSGAGVYKVQLNLTDQNKVTSWVATQADLEAIVVIYDPNGGYTYGGGWFSSPEGAFSADPTLTGKVSYGFTSSYFKNATNPKGETQFQFAVGNREFNALNFSYLSISGPRAQFKGFGKITGDSSGYSFVLTVIDGQATNGGGVDKIRMKIYNKNTGAIIYDNQMGASDAADPTTPVGEGSSIVIVTPNASASSASGEGENQPEEVAGFVPKEYALEQNYPNPFNPSTQIQFDLPEVSRVKVVIYDILGREVVTLVDEEMEAGRYQMLWYSQDRYGKSVASGIYLYRMDAVSLTSDRKLFSLKKMLLLH